MAKKTIKLKQLKTPAETVDAENRFRDESSMAIVRQVRVAQLQVQFIDEELEELQSRMATLRRTKKKVLAHIEGCSTVLRKR